MDMMVFLLWKLFQPLKITASFKFFRYLIVVIDVGSYLIFCLEHFYFFCKISTCAQFTSFDKFFSSGPHGGDYRSQIDPEQLFSLMNLTTNPPHIITRLHH